MARWPSAHSVRLNDFIGRPACVASLRAAADSATFKSGRHLLHARGDDELAGRRPGDEHFVVAIAVHGDAEQLDGSDRLGCPRGARPTPPAAPCSA